MNLCTILLYNVYAMKITLFLLPSSFVVVILVCCYQVNSSPYEKGWIIKVELNDSGELKNLMDSDKYTKFCDEEDAH